MRAGAGNGSISILPSQFALRSGATRFRLSQLNSHIANGRNMATFPADIAGMVAAVTESDPGVERERTSDDSLG